MASPHDMLWTKKDLTDIETKCGITGDAVLSDCDKLINDDATWDTEWHGDEDPATCTFTNPLDNKWAYPAFNPACLGECCIYVTERYGGRWDVDGIALNTGARVREMARAALACGSPSENKVNGQARDYTDRVCLSNREGCGDCFDDVGES